MGANTQGRILAVKGALKRALEAHAKARQEERNAEQDVRRLEQYEKDLAEYRKHTTRMYELEAKIRKQFETITNIGAAKNVVFDSTKALSRFFGYFKNPVVSGIASGVGAVAERLRGPTSSGLLGIIPGSTNDIGAVTLADNITDAAGITGALAEAQNLAGPALDQLGNANTLLGRFQDGYDVGQLLQGNNVLAATPIPRVGNIFNLPSDQLKEIASRVRYEFDEGLLEYFNGIDNTELARDIDEYRKARDASAAYGRKIRNPGMTLEEAEREEQLAHEKNEQAGEDVQAAIAALAQAYGEAGVSVEKK